jgi:hypothetical protein
MKIKQLFAPGFERFGDSFTFLWLVIAASAWFSGQSLAATQQDTEGVSSQEYRLPLMRLVPPGETLELRLASSEYTLFAPVPERWNVVDAELHLEYTNSISLLQQRSQLRVSFNERVIAQFPLKPDQPDAIADIKIPLDLITSDFNRLKFEVAQHNSLECEDPTSAELWTQIDSVNSYLSVSVEAHPISGQLSQLSKLVNRKFWDSYELNLVTVGDDISEAQLGWGASIAQMMALRLDYVPFKLHHARSKTRLVPVSGAEELASHRFPMLDQTELLGRDTVLVGTATQLEALLGTEFTAAVTGAYLAIYPLDEDPAHFLLVVSGTTNDEVALAANALGFHNFPFPENQSTIVSEWKLPEIPRYAARNAIAPNARYDFSTLGYQTTTYRGFKASNLAEGEIKFWLPPDFFTAGRENVELSLHLAYGAALRSDSVLNILVNNRFERAIGLNDPAGAMYRDYQIIIPLNAFSPGPNVITFEPRMMPSVADFCVIGQSENLALTLFDDSEIRFPELTHFTSLPDLDLFAKTGFPYTTVQADEYAALQVAGKDSQTVGAALSLVGKLAQLVDVPLKSLQVSFDAVPDNVDILLVGAASEIDQKFMAATDFALGNPSRVALPLETTVNPDRVNRSRLAELLDRATGEPDPVTDLRTPQQLHITKTGTLGGYKLMLQTESPLSRSRTLTILTASNTTDLAEGVNSLVNPEIWNNLNGHMVLWRDKLNTLVNYAGGTEFHVGQASVDRTLSYYFSNYPLEGLLITMAVIVMAAFFIYLLLRRFVRREKV